MKTTSCLSCYSIQVMHDIAAGGSVHFGKKLLGLKLLKLSKSLNRKTQYLMQLHTIQLRWLATNWVIFCDVSHRVCLPLHHIKSTYNAQCQFHLSTIASNLLRAANMERLDGGQVISQRLVVDSRPCLSHTNKSHFIFIPWTTEMIALMEYSFTFDRVYRALNLIWICQTGMIKGSNHNKVYTQGLWGK